MEDTMRQVYEGLKSKLQEPTALAVIFTIFTFLLTTRLLSPKGESCTVGARIAGSPGYYNPFLGHVPQIAYDVNTFLDSLRTSFPSGLFSLNHMGAKHTFVLKRQFSTQLMNKPHSVADEDFLLDHLMAGNFAFTEKDKKAFQPILKEVMDLHSSMLSGDMLNQLVDTTVRNLKSTIAGFVTFNSYPANQMEWERSAEADVVESSLGEQWVEADLVNLTKHFVAQTANPSLFGTDFCTYFPDFADCIWQYDAAFVLSMMRIPTWLPIPSLNRAKRAQNKLVDNLIEFHEAYQKHMKGEDPGHRWNDMDNVSNMVKARAECFEKSGIPLSLRAKSDLSLLWAMNANSSPMVYWMLLHICRNIVLMEQIREEIAPFVQAVQPKDDFGTGVWIPPRIEILDVEGLIRKFPLLKSAYVESMRLYTGVWSIKWIKQDTTLGRGDESYLLVWPWGCSA